MSQPVPPDPELTAVEAALGSLSPAASRVKRDQLMFEAGRRSARTARATRWAWPSIAACLALVALGEGLVLKLRPPRTVSEYVTVEQPHDSSKPTVVILKTAPEPLPLPASSNADDGATGNDRFRLRSRNPVFDALANPNSVTLDSGARPIGVDPRPSRVLLRSELDHLLKPGEPS